MPGGSSGADSGARVVPRGVPRGARVGTYGCTGTGALGVYRTPIGSNRTLSDPIGSL